MKNVENSKKDWDLWIKFTTGVAVIELALK